MLLPTLKDDDVLWTSEGDGPFDLVAEFPLETLIDASGTIARADILWNGECLTFMNVPGDFGGNPVDGASGTLSMFSLPVDIDKQMPRCMADVIERYIGVIPPAPAADQAAQ